MASALPIMVVGTSAPRRRYFVEDAFGREFDLRFVSPDIDEKAYRSHDAAELTGMIANAKMDAVLAQVEREHHDLSALLRARPGSVAVTFDQVVVWEGEIREKPVDAAQARRFIRDYSCSQLMTVQSTCLFAFDHGKRVLCPNVTRTYYNEIADNVVDRIVARGACLHTAGAFVVEDADMQARMIKVDPGSEVEVQGVSERAIREGLERIMTRPQS